MGSYIGVDIGEKRIGIAICDTVANFPAPLTTLEASPQLAQEFAEILKKHAVSAVVIGYPRNQQGEATQQTARVEHIAKLLKVPSSTPVYWQDESLTSVKAQEELNRRKKPYDKGDVDALAATYILEDFIRTQLPLVKNAKSADVSSVPDPGSKSKKPKRKKNIVLALLAALFVIIATALIGCFAWYLNAISPKNSSENYQVVVVKPGSGTQIIAQDLEQKGIIKSALAFTLFTRLNGVNNLQAGSYRISSSQPVSEIVELIAKGGITTINVLIPPGQRLDEILDSLEKDGYSASELREAVDSVRDHPLLTDVPQDARLEGYLFPDTYKIGPDTSAEALFRLMLNTFQSKITAEITSGIAKQGLTFEQAVILASIVQKEESDPEVQKTIAQVFIKRFKEGMPLGADPTFKYAAAQFGTVNSPASESKYNTRRFTGLPPTAISNFNISAIAAVANPDNTNYTYFVHGDDGTAHFSNTLQQHQENTRKFCTEACR